MTDLKGYTPPTDEQKALGNSVKVMEEHVMRLLDKLMDDPDTDKRAVAIARTDIQTGFMWMVRSIFKPQRIELPDAPST